MKQRIAAFLNDIGPAVLSRAEQKNLFGIVLSGCELEHFARSQCACPLIPISRTANAPLSSNEDVLDDAILHTNLSEQLRRNAITAILVPAQQSSLRIVRWARDNGITLLGTPHSLQRTLEDKIKFDALMRRHGIRVPAKINSRGNIRVVLQKRSGCGGSGTTILRADDITRASANHNILIRKYIDGTPLGVSIIIDSDGNYFCSALRRQCFVINKNSPQLLGLQWVPTESFSKKSFASIEKMIAQLIQFFLSVRFIGVANIDFILAKDGAYVIECNPRFSGATPQVFSKKELTPHPHAWRFLLNALTHKKNTPFHDARIPFSAYSGSLTYIDAERKEAIFCDVPVGYYMIKDGVLRQCRKKVPRSFFLLHELPPGSSIIKKGETLCYVLTDEPLFSKDGQSPHETAQLRNACYNLFIRQQTET